MNLRNLAIILFSVAAIAASFAYIRGSIAKEAVARLNAETAAAEEAKAIQDRKAAEAAASAERDRKATAEADRIAAEKVLEANEASARAAKEDAKAAAEGRKAKELSLQEAKIRSETAEKERENAAARLKIAEAEKAKALAEEKTAAAKAAEAADRLQQEKMRSEKTIADAKMLELRKIDFERIELELTEWQQDLEAREKAIKPEKTIADLVWAGGKDDKFIDSKGNLVTRQKRAYSAEDDLTLPRETRELARLTRELKERRQSDRAAVISNLVSELRHLRDRALEEDRIIDADFYLKTENSVKKP